MYRKLSFQCAIFILPSENEITNFHFIIIMFGRRKYYVRGVGLRNTHILVLEDSVWEDYTASAAKINSGNLCSSQAAWREIGKLDRAHLAGYVAGLRFVKDKISSHSEEGDVLNLQDLEKSIDQELFDVNHSLEWELPFYDIEVIDADNESPPRFLHREPDTEYIVIEDKKTE